MLLCLGTLPISRAQCPPPACTPGNAPAANLAFGMGIFRVQLASLDTTTNGAADGYRDYSCGHGTVLQRGSTYTLAVRTNPNADENVRAWVDFDNNGQFTAAEQVMASTARQHQASFTVPAAAVLGQPLRLRIAADYANAAVPTACSTPQYSQTEDYRVVVSATAPVRPVARFAATDTVSCGAAVAFRDQSLNTPTAWRWTFGDGTSSTQQHPQHTYALPGTYAVRLRACNATGCDSLTKTNYILVRADAPLPASCQPATSSYCCSYGITRFRLGTIDRASADGSAGYEDFSCAQRTLLTADRPYTLQLSTGTNAQDVRVYLDRNDNGRFDLPGELLYEGLAVRNPSVVVQVASGAGLATGRPLRLRCWVDAAGNAPFGPCAAPQQGQVEDYSVVVAANAAPPTAAFTFTYQQLCLPVQIALTNATTGGATSYAWDFGDGTTSTAASPPAHAYPQGGVYDLTLVARNAFGTDTLRRTVNVASACPPYCVADGYGGSNSAPAYFTRVLFAGLDNNDPRSPGVSYRDYTSRYAELQQGQVYSIRTEFLPWTFSGNGPWVYVNAWIDFNQDGNFTANELLSMPRLTFSPRQFTFQVPLGARPGATRLRLQIAGNSINFAMDNPCPPNYQNASTEDYTVVITGAAQAPQAAFTVNLTPTCNATVQLQDSSLAAPNRWLWTFGDGASSTQQHPQHTYALPGTYTVSLRASNRFGSSLLTKPRFITVSSLAQGPRPAACLPPGGGDVNLGGYWEISSTAIGNWTYTNPLRLAAYRDETCGPPIPLVAGTTVPVTMRKPNSNYLLVIQFIMWLDANDDGVFDPVTERVYTYQASGYGPAWTGSLAVPTTAVRNRPLRLRVWWQGSGGNTYTPLDRPCYRTELYGQVRDFTAIVSSPLAAKSGIAPSVLVYPNPSGGLVTLQSETPLQGPVQVRNTTGQLVFEQAAPKSPSRNLNLSHLPDGIYFLHLPGNQVVRKINIMH
ncbi:GEVED domain-containing protein [Hymenobacter properus]|uniref:PKD domain-containing protein n=1 Tax=Hymenobacter properus TaxID=2791026 RepID=A0A931BL52_9BACT|nr:GEVED domain-containing protein [Hymenobacter properus]MBF9144203.1 PKD domain-containing protein [Hymenobacter properus]MBR7723021.1 PKD domain-containing protein [Microvirga sp. SRT04]